MYVFYIHYIYVRMYVYISPFHQRLESIQYNAVLVKAATIHRASKEVIYKHRFSEQQLQRL